MLGAGTRKTCSWPPLPPVTNHKLWYLHLCAVNGIVVQAYTDHTEAEMDEGDARQPGRFVSATLRPQVTIAAAGDADLAQALHEQAHHACFIANSLNFPVYCEAEIQVAAA